MHVAHDSHSAPANDRPRPPRRRPAARPAAAPALAALAALLVTVACDQPERGPLRPAADESGLDPAATDRTAPTLLPPSPRTAGAIAASPASPLDPLDSNSWIFINFSGRMDETSAAGIVVHSAAGERLPLRYEWAPGATTGVVLRPEAALAPNTIYLLRLAGDRIRDQGGNPLDLDGDGSGGEHPDDDLVFPYRTQRRGDVFRDLDRDGRWDSGSIWEDRNGNGRFDPPPAGPDSLLYDTFDDGSGAPRGDGQPNAVEPLILDQNGNGVADPGDRWFDNIENGVWDARAEPLLEDRNGNRVFDPPAAGDPLPVLLDGFPPVMLPFSANSIPGGDLFVHFLVPGSADTRPFVDAAVAVRVQDEAILGGVVERTGLPTPLVAGALVLEEVDSGVRVPGSIRYEKSGPLESDACGRLSLQPALELRPGVEYRLVVAAALADTAGNKLDRDGDGWVDGSVPANRTRRFRTLDQRSDGTVVADDVLAPEVVQFESESGAFVVVFSELIDPRTLTDATVRLERDGRRVHGLLSRGHRFLGDPNQGPEVRLVTTVRFVPAEAAVRDGRATVTTAVRDFSGNRLARDQGWFWTGGEP